MRALCLVLASCNAELAPPAGERDSNDQPAEPPDAPADLGLRPLTADELDHAVQDLLGIAWAPSELLPAPVQSGYATDVRGGSVDAYRVERMLAVAQAAGAQLEHADPRHTVVVELEDLDVAWDDLVLVPGAINSTWVTTFTPRTIDVPVRLAVGGLWRLTLPAGQVIVPPAGVDDFDAPLTLGLRLDGASLAEVPLSGLGHAGLPFEIDLVADAGRHVLTLDLPATEQRVPLVDGVRLVPAGGAPGSVIDALACEEDRDPVGCVEAVLAPLARRGWRRPLDEARRAGLRALLDAEAARGGGAVDLLRLGVEAVLASPEFWFVAEGGEGPVAGGRYALGPHEVATRLALLVWQSLPDEALLDCADAGGLSPDDAGTCGLAAQLDRLLDDARSSRLVDGFAMAWLGVGRLDGLTLDTATFPELDAVLVDALREETRLVVEEVFFGGGPLGALVSADFTWVDARLAEHYGLPAPQGTDFARVATDPAVRGGALRTGGVLLATAHPTRVSDVRRGAMLLSAFACEPQDPPPPGIPPLADDDGARAGLLDQTAYPSCATCHDALNPYGFALSAYDVAGRHAPASFVDVAERGYPTHFDGVEALLAHLGRDDLASRCFARHLTSWAVSRDLASLDEGALTAIEQELTASGASLRAALHAVVRSPAFLGRPVEAP